MLVLSPSRETFCRFGVGSSMFSMEGSFLWTKQCDLKLRIKRQGGSGGKERICDSEVLAF